MAESFLFGIAESLIGKLASTAYEEASKVIGVYDDLREIKQTLSFVKAVLLDAEQKQEHNHELQEWLRQIKHVFSDAEDVIDEFDCERLRKQVVKASGSTKTKVGRFFSSSNPLVFRYRMAGQIKEIRKRLNRIAADRNNFGLEIIDVDRRVVHRREMTHSHVIPSDVIGREHDKEKVIELLMHDDDKSLSIIPIVGIGGLGKTTLAKLVYNDKNIGQSFPLKMWVCVSDDFDIKQVIIKIINSANDASFVAPSVLVHQQSFNKLDMQNLQTQLRNKLNGQKFLLVLDDVWNEDLVKWVELRSLIQVGGEGSKILVTTRSHSIASMMGTIPSYLLEGLSQEDSLSLFVKWAFKGGEEEKYPDLVKIGGEIVKKCGGIPLAVRTLGSSLFSKLEVDEWESVRDNEIWNLPQKKDDILAALKLSYDQIPTYLKRCFACFSLYPKDYEFLDREISPVWQTLGLLPSPNRNKTLDDVARQYLHELLSRSLLQDFQEFGPFCLFKMHDLVHDLAMYVAKDEFRMVNSHTQNIPENVQHLSFVENDSLCLASLPKSTSVRTILFPFKGVGAKSEAFLNTVVSRYKYLRLLDLSDSSYENLPHSIGKLKHLRCLDLANNTKIKRLPHSVCKLQNLETLALSGCTKLETLPNGLGNLISLRYLDITTKQSILPESEIANLNSLELLGIHGCDNIESLFREIKLPTLKFLNVSHCKNLRSLPFDLKNFPELEILAVENCDKLELSKGHDYQNPNLRLRLVTFDNLAQLVTLPRWLQGGANTLQVLIIANCENIEVLPEWLPTLTHLNRLIISSCPKLRSLPVDMHRLTALEHLTIEDCPELCRKCQPQVGEDWPKISHIKHITIDEPEELEVEEMEKEEESEEEQEEEESEEEQEEEERR